LFSIDPGGLRNEPSARKECDKQNAKCNNYQVRVLGEQQSALAGDVEP
jgi:hypothetical protein